jgi:secreted Zn-dependent insulinase-like peptidase
MTWPVPPELVLSAPQLVWEWDEGAGTGEKEVSDILDTLEVEQARVVLMTRVDEYAKICEPTTRWEKEPWYGTLYHVEKFDDSFIREVRITHMFSGLQADLILRLMVPMIFLNFAFQDLIDSFRPISTSTRWRWRFV